MIILRAGYSSSRAAISGMGTKIRGLKHSRGAHDHCTLCQAWLPLWMLRHSLQCSHPVPCCLRGPNSGPASLCMAGVKSYTHLPPGYAGLSD